MRTGNRHRQRRRVVWGGGLGTIGILVTFAGLLWLNRVELFVIPAQWRQTQPLLNELERRPSNPELLGEALESLDELVRHQRSDVSDFYPVSFLGTLRNERGDVNYLATFDFSPVDPSDENRLDENAPDVDPFASLVCIAADGFLLGKEVAMNPAEQVLQKSLANRKEVLVSDSDALRQVLDFGGTLIAVDRDGIVPLCDAILRRDPKTGFLTALPVSKGSGSAIGRGVELRPLTPARDPLDEIDHPDPYTRARAAVNAADDRTLGAKLERVTVGLPEHLEAAVHLALLRTKDRAVASRSFVWLCDHGIETRHRISFEAETLSSPAAVEAVCSWGSRDSGAESPNVTEFAEYLSAFRNEDVAAVPRVFRRSGSRTLQTGACSLTTNSESSSRLCCSSTIRSRTYSSRWCSSITLTNNIGSSKNCSTVVSGLPGS